MLYRLKRHPLPIKAFFRHSLVLTYAFPPEILTPLLAPGLELDVYKDRGFLAIAMVQTEKLRPVGLPAIFGQNFFLTGYRIFARYRTRDGQLLRGLRILRSDTDRRRMAFFGNRLTHYNYHLARVGWRESPGALQINVRTPRGEADLSVEARLNDEASALPANSPFADWTEARRFAGPLPYTFDYERQTNSIVVIKGVRRNWKPRPVEATVRQCTFVEQPPFDRAAPVLANAFYVNQIDYGWLRGVREQLPAGGG